jgi:hypothetical protein
MYMVARLKDTAKPAHGGNVEYAPDFNYTVDELFARDCAHQLNALDGEATVRPWAGNHRCAACAWPP